MAPTAPRTAMDTSRRRPRPRVSGSHPPGSTASSVCTRPREIAEQQGTIQRRLHGRPDGRRRVPCAASGAVRRGSQITTFGPYSPGQAVVMKRMGIDAIYLGGWATSAKGSASEDPGPDLASYPLSQVPDEAAGLVRALLTADKNQHFARAQMDEGKRRTTPASRLPPVHHRRRRHRPRRRRARSEPDPAIRRGRRARAITSRTRSRAPRSAVIRAARSWSARTSRTSASTRRASSSTSCACRASSSPGPMPSRPPSSTTAPTSATSRSSSGRPTPTCRATGSASWRS